MNKLFKLLFIGSFFLCAATLHAQVGTTSTSFATRCAQGGVVKCVTFDSVGDINAGYDTPNTGLLSGATVDPVIDTTQAASGAGSLMFTVPAQSGASASGAYYANFSTDLMTQFGASTDFYVQWRQRFSQAFVDTHFTGGNGWKQAIIGSGDVGSTHYYTCTDLEVVAQDTFYYGFSQMYNSCNASASHGAFDDLYENIGGGDLKLQNGIAAPYCLYSQRTTFAAGNCAKYYANEWMTFEIHLTVGARSNGEFISSHIQLYIARENQPATLAIDFGPYNLNAGSAGANQKFGKVWLIPYNTNKNASTVNPVAYTWYDDLIISTNPIPVYVPSTLSKVVTFTITGTDATSYKYTLDGAAPTTFSPVASPLTGDFTLTLTGLSAGAHTVIVSSCNSGGCSDSVPMKFTSATTTNRPSNLR